MTQPMSKTMDMVAALNRKTAEAGCEVRASATTARRTHWDAVVLVGGDAAQQDRAVRFLQAYYAAKIARHDTTLADKGVVDAATCRDWSRLPVRSGKVRLIAFCDESFHAA